MSRSDSSSSDDELPRVAIRARGKISSHVSAHLRILQRQEREEIVILDDDLGDSIASSTPKIDDLCASKRSCLEVDKQVGRCVKRKHEAAVDKCASRKGPVAEQVEERIQRKREEALVSGTLFGIGISTKNP